MATQLSTLSILLMDVAVGLGCGVAAYLLSAYTTTTIVGGATTKIVKVIPEKIKESITEAASAATNAAAGQLEQTANNQIANATTAATNMTGDALLKAEKMVPTNEGLEMSSFQPPTNMSSIQANMSSLKPPTNMPSFQPPTNMSSFQPPTNMSSIQANMSAVNPDALNTMGSKQDLLKTSFENANNQFAVGEMKIPSSMPNIPGQISNIQGQMSNIQGQMPNIQGQMSNIKGQMPNIKGQMSNIKGQMANIQNTRGLKKKIPVRQQGGRKTKSKKQRKPRTKKCLITKGDKMFMSFCI